jgi:hypothetical protein
MASGRNGAGANLLNEKVPDEALEFSPIFGGLGEGWRILGTPDPPNRLHQCIFEGAVRFCTGYM